MANVPHKFKNGVKISGTAEVNSDTVLTETAAQTITGKTIDGGNNTLQNIPSSALAANLDAAKIADGSVSNTEFQYLDGVTGAIQTQLDAKIASSEKGAANGVATLDGSAKIPTSQLPALAITDVHVVADITARNALTVQEGDVAKVNDADGSGNPNSYIYDGASWIDLKSDDAVDTVNGQTGTVSLDSDDIAEGATNLYFTDERARDAAGAMATDSSKVSLTYNDTSDTLTPDIVAGSLVNADINALAAIDASKIHDGTVSNTEFKYLDGVTSGIQSQLDSKLNLSGGTMTGALTLSGAPTADLHASTKKYVDDEIVAAAGANKTLSNLTSPTSINQSLLSSDGTQSIGGTSGDHFSVIHTNSQEVGYSAQGKTIYKNSGGSRVHVGVESSTSTPSGALASSTFRTVDTLAGNIGVFTVNDSANNATASSSVLIETGNKSAGTGDSGDISLTTGTSAGGARGSIILDAAEIDASTSKIVNVVDPTLAQDAATKKYVDDSVAAVPSGSAGDIEETSFSMANNQATPADVTGLSFPSGTVRSAKALVSVEIDATADLFESFELLIIQKGADYDMTVNAVGDVSNVNFSITSAGQVQYTSGNEAGFVSGDIKFRAITTTV